jgi:hypothetical protein
VKREAFREGRVLGMDLEWTAGTGSRTIVLCERSGGSSEEGEEEEQAALEIPSKLTPILRVPSIHAGTARWGQVSCVGQAIDGFAVVGILSWTQRIPAQSAHNSAPFPSLFLSSTSTSPLPLPLTSHRPS